MDPTTAPSTEPRPASQALNPRWLGVRLRVALRHFYEKDIEPEELELMFTDWWEVLRHFPQKAVARAFVQWIGAETRAPKPADIRHLAAAAVKVEHDRARHLALAAPPPLQLVRPSAEEEEAQRERRRVVAAEITGRFLSARRVEPAPHDAPRGPRPAYMDPASPAYGIARAAMGRGGAAAQAEGEA